ncbi:glycosyltransferase family 34 protein [Cucurbitaria berberidis CBS 394.84]|uniref:Glycosyltransferase family 34 protein n=1 Tax=Cucurbitaria berberidis CBS 394.84 TaxID=1168544 RepID=A0A9P4LFE0_9PLEO|nr:glycosyltransferase family 34 protein [Cucurbitaria berberidis CBS 394.84]KAF1851974.1 glycosyltransferase family 34 protein [Cucurbitaria berberidis CBS 394.84]
MHFAMPPRKTSRPPPYARNQGSIIAIPPALKNLLRRDKLRLVVVGILGFLGIVWLLGRRGGNSQGVAWTAAHIPKVAIGSGAPVVIVTVIDPKADPSWTQRIKSNREEYAKRHGYLTFFPTDDQYPLRGSPATWSRVPAIRHAMTLYPGSTFFWYLDATALIMTPSLAIHTHLLTPARLESLMITNAPVVPPDSVIKTFSNLKGDRIDFVVTQDKEGLAPSSFVIRNGEWAKYFLDAWFDPIYRSYNFQKAESHALEHIVQWHGTILAKLALVPQNMLNAYASGPASLKDGQFKEGNLVATFPGCDKDARDCAKEQQTYFDVLERTKT